MDIILVLGAFGGMLGGFFAISKIMLNSATQEREADRKERIELSKAIASMAANMGQVAENMKEVANSNQKIADESEKRNGHIVELSIENKNQVLDRIDGVIINKQTVHRQVIEEQVTKETR